MRSLGSSPEYPPNDLPPIVITGGLPEETGADAAAREEEHRKDHAAVAALARRGKHIIAERSHHHVQIEEPQLVASATREIIAATRK